MPHLRVDGHGDLFAQAFVRHAEHGRFVNCGVFVDDVLHLGAVHVLACAKNHVFGAVFDVEEALFVHAADVPRQQPAINDRG